MEVLTAMTIIIVFCIILSLPVYILYLLAKRSEIYGVTAMSLVIAEASALLQWSETINDFLFKLFQSFAIIWLILFLCVNFINFSIEQGRKDFYKNKKEYNKLVESDKNKLSRKELKRFIKLDKRKYEFEGEFSPETIRGSFKNKKEL